MKHKNFKQKLLTLGVCAAISGATQPVFAQEQVEELLVTGSFRDSLATALNVKRSNTAAIDSIVADDIASFPDNNLAESMQRIPGVNISRVAVKDSRSACVA